MGQEINNKIVYNKHPSDFVKGSVIKNIKIKNIWLVTDIEAQSKNIYAILIQDGKSDISRLGRSYIIGPNDEKSNFEILRGGLKE